MAPGSDTRGRLSPYQHELLHESGNNANGQNAVGIIVHPIPIILDRESIQTQSTEKILDEKSYWNETSMAWLKRGTAFRIRVVGQLVRLKSR
jgi:hypothetical protein